MKVDRTEFAVKFHEGLNRLELSEHFKCAPQTVSVIRKELGLPAFKGTPRWVTVERHTALEQMLDDGMSFMEIHRTEGVSPLTLQKRFPGRAWTKEQSEELRTAQRNARKIIRKHYGASASNITVGK